MLEKGLEVAGLRRSRIWVRPQRKPEKKAARMTSMKPTTLKSTSPATIIITPAVMVIIMKTSFQDGVSRRKRKANPSTKARADDLHIAMLHVSSTNTKESHFRSNRGCKVGRILTIERQGDEFQTHIPKSNV